MKKQNSEVTLETIISRHKKADAEMWLFIIFSSILSRALFAGVSRKDIVAVFNKACGLADEFTDSYWNKHKNEKK